MPSLTTLVELAYRRHTRALHALRSLRQAIRDGHLDESSPVVQALISLHERALDNAATLLELTTTLCDAARVVSSAAGSTHSTPPRSDRL